MDSIAADERLRYTWYSTFLKSNGVTPKPFNQWVAAYRQKSGGEVDKMAAGEESYEVQRQASNVWDGFWESFFNAARGGQLGDQMVQEPSPDNGAVAPISQPPTGEPEPSVDDAPVEPEVQPESNQLTRTLAALMDEYSENNRTVQEWTEDFDKALRRMALANQLDAAMERHQLVQALGDALDQGILKDQLAKMLEERLNPSEFEEPTEHADYALPEWMQSNNTEEQRTKNIQHINSALQSGQAPSYDVLHQQLLNYASGGNPSAYRDPNLLKGRPSIAYGWNWTDEGIAHALGVDLKHIPTLRKLGSIVRTEDGYDLPEPPEQSEYTIQPTNGKWHPKNRFAKQMYASLMQQFCPEQYGAGTEVDLQSEPDRYPEAVDQYGMWNPLQHPRDPSGHFAKKAGSDDSGAAMAMDAPGPGVEGGGEIMPMQAPPLPPARAAVARIELPEKIDHRIKEVARHIPDYFLDGNGRTKTSHITIKMFSEDEPEDIAKVLQGEAPFRVVLGKANIIEATESRPYDILKVDVHSPSIRRLHNKLSESLSGVRGGNGYQPFIKIADVQPGMGDKLIGWDGLEGESVIVKSLTFVRKDHTAHEIQLQGRQDEYQLDEYSQPMAYSMPEQYAKRKRSSGSMPLFDRPVQQEARPPEESQTFAPASAPRQQSLGIERVPPQTGSPKIETPAPSSHVTQPSAMDAPGDTDIPSLPDMTPDTKGPRDESVPTSIEPAIQDDAPGTPSDGPGESLEDFGRERHDRDDSGRSSEPVDTGISGPRGIKTAREQFTPPAESIDTSIVPETVRDYLKPFQLADTAMALHAMTTHGGFLNAGGTGSGKSWSQVAVAKYWMDKGMKVLLVTPNEVVSPNWKTGQIHGAFKSAGQKMNAMPRLNDGSKSLNPGEFHVTTYHRFHGLESQVDENTVVLWDESHLLKNLTSDRSQVGDRMNQKANSVMYSTATPADKPIHIAHLSRAKVFGNRSPEATYKELGLEPYADVDKEGKEHINWRISPDVGPLEVSRRLNGLFNRMTEEGLMVKRDLDMTGVRIKTRKIKLPPEAHDILKKIEDEATGGMGLHSLKKKGVLLQHLRRQQETFKVPHIVNSIKEALAENPNRQIVVYVSRVNPADVKYHGKTIHSSRGTPELIKKAFEGVKGVRIGELHGGSRNDPHASMRNFQEGATNVLIATMERGGIGIDLDDQVGNRPRTMIVATAPFSGDRNVQAGGRVWRETTKSKHGDTVIDYMFGDTEVDDWNQGIIATKMRTLGAIIEGEARSLDVNIPFDIGEEALEELAQSDASERIRRRDSIAKSQMHEPYRWRQLSGLEDIKPEVQPGLGMEGIEDLKPGDPGYHAMMTKGDKEAGYRPSKPRQKKSPVSAQGQQSLFTQDGEPERYTMTAAEVSKAVKEWKEPSESQVKAGNYRKPRLHLHGLEIAIENPRGTSRKAGWKPLAHHYGYCVRIAGAPAPDARDGDRVDVFIGPNPESEIVFAVDQEHPSGRYDEPKILMGFTNLREARKGYLDNYPSDWHCGPITALTMNQFRAWLESGDTTRRIAEQVGKYAAKYDFDDLHPRDNDTKRFIPKHKSVALAQAAKRPATPGEKRAYKKYAAFVRVGGTDPLPFKKWLQFHRAEKFRTQEQEIQRDSAEQEGSEASQVQDQAATGGQDQAETQPTRPSRSTGEPSRNSLIHNFAAALYDSYYQDSE